MSTYSIIIVETYTGGESQSKINCGTDQLIFSTASDESPAWIDSPFSITANGYQYSANLTNTSPPSGSLGERIESVIASGSAISLNHATPANITSISLSAGIWDVCAILAVEGIITGTSMDGSISTSSATQGTPGDNLVQIGLWNFSSAQMLSIPSYRMELSGSTTVYLVANVAFSLGSAYVYGRISAARTG